MNITILDSNIGYNNFKRMTTVVDFLAAPYRRREGFMAKTGVIAKA